MLQVLVNGLSFGGLYLLFALGLVATYFVLKVPWFAHATLILLGGYFTYVFVNLGLNFWIAAIISMVLCPILAFLFERYFLRPFYRLTHAQFFVAIFSFYTIMQYSAYKIWGISNKGVGTFSSAIFSIGDIRITSETIIIISISLVAIVAMWLFLKKTRSGKAIRAVSQDSDAASVLGISIGSTRGITFLISGVFAGLAGSLFIGVHSINPFIADYIIIKIFIVVILSGFGNLLGTLVAAYGLGISESFIAYYLSSGLKDVILFFFIIIFLLIRPRGIFEVKGRKERG